MPKNYRTSRGKVIDMSSIIAKNERVRAVGNMSVNARGDTIDAQGRIIKPVTQKVGEAYANTVGNKSSHVTKSSNQVKRVPNKQPQKTKEEFQLDDQLSDDLEIEKIKAKENKK